MFWDQPVCIIIVLIYTLCVLYRWCRIFLCLCCTSSILCLFFMILFLWYCLLFLTENKLEFELNNVVNQLRYEKNLYGWCVIHIVYVFNCFRHGWYHLFIKVSNQLLLNIFFCHRGTAVPSSTNNLQEQDSNIYLRLRFNIILRPLQGRKPFSWYLFLILYLYMYRGTHITRKATV